MVLEHKLLFILMETQGVVGGHMEDSSLFYELVREVHG